MEDSLRNERSPQMSGQHKILNGFYNKPQGAFGQLNRATSAVKPNTTT